MDGGPEGDNAPIKQPDTIFIQGLLPDVTQDQLKEHFGSVGPIKVHTKVIHRVYKTLLSVSLSGILRGETLAKINTG